MKSWMSIFEHFSGFFYLIQKHSSEKVERYCKKKSINCKGLIAVN